MPFLEDFYVGAMEDEMVPRSQASGYSEMPMIIGGSINMENSGSVDYTHKDLTMMHSSKMASDYAEEFIYNRIWITPLIDFDFIVEIETDYIAIWNAFLDRSVDITAFNDPGHSGITIDPVTIPTTLETNEEVIYEVIVTPTGPAEQNTTYSFTVLGEVFESLVIGKRVIPFPFAANWGNNVTLDYEYLTSIYTAPTTHEQRRSIVDSVKRYESFSCSLSRIQAQTFDNLYRKGAYRYIGVPIYPEVFTTTGTITGATSITVTEDITYFYNLQNHCTQILIVNHDTLEAEIKIITLIEGQVITLDIEVAGTFTPANTTMYPIFIGMLSGYNYRNLTDSVLVASVSFTEKFIG